MTPPDAGRLAAIRRALTCSHRDRSGGNDYIECGECGLMWDYRREGPEQAAAREALALLDAQAEEIAQLRQELDRISQDNAVLRHDYSNSCEWLQQAEAKLATLRARLEETIALLEAPCPYDKNTTLAAARAALKAEG